MEVNTSVPMNEDEEIPGNGISNDIDETVGKEDEEAVATAAKVARSATGTIPKTHQDATTTTTTTTTSSSLTPMEIALADDDDDDDDMESLLPGAATAASGKQLAKPTKSYLNGWVRPQPIGNMQILFPEYFDTSGWGVLGPQWFGPVCVWLILVVATHFCLRRAHHLGPISVVLCYMFFGVSTYLLTDVSFRDPGICLDTQIPSHVPEAQIRGWRWCDFCKVYQPPDGAHCPDCNVCIAGYDHHCVWMGTCVGRKNYKQFVKFNISWLYYAGYALFWLALFGPLAKGGAKGV